jgi:deazaflavin-dependent oxidoreductase (nitroreductase family)
MPNVRWLLALVTRLHRSVYVLTGGRVGGNLAGIRVLLLTTVGRRSGRERATPLLYVEAEKAFVVVASNAGDDRDPAWWRNLLSRPEASVQVGRERHAVRARRATAAEEAELWPRLVAAYGPYARYRERTRRAIPIAILERV